MQLKTCPKTGNLNFIIEESDSIEAMTYIKQLPGFDGHSIRALKYFPEKMPDIKAKVDKAETATKFWRDENGDVHCS